MLSVRQASAFDILTVSAALSFDPSRHRRLLHCRRGFPHLTLLLEAPLHRRVGSCVLVCLEVSCTFSVACTKFASVLVALKPMRPLDTLRKRRLWKTFGLLVFRDCFQTPLLLSSSLKKTLTEMSGFVQRCVYSTNLAHPDEKSRLLSERWSSSNTGECDEVAVYVSLAKHAAASCICSCTYGVQLHTAQHRQHMDCRVQ